MANDSDMVSLKRLIDAGKDKGYITYEELNDDLPEDVVSSEYIDDLMMMFEELDIMVIDEASKEEIEKSKKLKKKQKKAQEKENFRAQISDTGARVSDPVKMYLKEMGCISLLTREGEVEIAKRIEAGENEALDTLLECHVGIEHIIELGKKLQDGEVKLKDVINDMDDDEDSHLQLSEKKKSIVTLIEDIETLYEQCRVAQREIAKAAYRYQREIEEKDRIIVGINEFIEDGEEIKIPILTIDKQIEIDQCKALKKLREERDNNKVKRSLQNLQRVAKGNENTVPAIIECAKCYATEGEIVDVLRDIFGEYQEPPLF